jgi:hypothetical protein
MEQNPDRQAITKGLDFHCPIEGTLTAFLRFTRQGLWHACFPTTPAIARHRSLSGTLRASIRSNSTQTDFCRQASTRGVRREGHPGIVLARRVFFPFQRQPMSSISRYTGNAELFQPGQKWRIT